MLVLPLEFLSRQLAQNYLDIHIKIPLIQMSRHEGEEGAGGEAEGEALEAAADQEVLEGGCGHLLGYLKGMRLGAEGWQSLSFHSSREG